MKLHLPKLLLTAVLAACVAPTAWAGTYSAVYKGTEDNAYIHNYNFVNDENSGESLGWEAAISNNAQNTDQNRIIHFTSATTDVANNVLKIDFNSLQIGGIVVDADTKVAGLTYNSNRSFYFGKDGETSASSINRDFSITPTLNLYFNGTQTWNIASDATLTLNAGSSSSVILNAGSAITQQGGTMSFSGDSVTGTGSYIVESGTLSNAVFKSGATLGLGSSNAVLSTVTMESGSILDLTKLTLSADAAAVSTTGVTLKSGMIVSLSGIEEGDAVKIFDTSVSGVSFIIDGEVIAAGRSEITENSGSYTFTSLGVNFHDMVWAGGDGTWNKTNTNWNSATGGDGIAFADGDTVTFSSSAAVVVGEGVSVGGMTVSGSSTELSLTRTDSGYIDGTVMVTDGATMIIGSEVGSTGFVRGTIDVVNGVLQFDRKDVTGYNGGANSTSKITIASGSTLQLNHTGNETFAGELVLNGTVKGIKTSAAQFDFYGNNAKLMVEANQTAKFENVTVRLRQNNTQIDVGSGATLTTADVTNPEDYGNGTFIKKGDGEMIVGGTLDVATAQVEAGTLSIRKNATLSTELRQLVGTVNVGTDTMDSVLLTTNRLELGDNNSSVSTAVLNISQGATVKVLGDKNETDYGNVSLMLGEWEAGAEVNVDGALLASSAKALVGDKSMTINIHGTGTVAVKGIGIADVKDVKTQSTTISLADNGKLLLGDGGIAANLKTPNITLNAGTIGSTAEAMTLGSAMTLSSSSGTTIDTDLYAFANDGNSVNKATAGETADITISGVLSGTGKLIKDGAGTLNLTQTNTYTGGTEVKAGVLEAATGAALGKGGTTTISGGSLEITDAKATITKSAADTNAAVSYITGVTDSSGDVYSIGNSGYQVENAKVELAANSDTTISNRLVGVELVNNGTGTITAGNGFNDFTSINAASGDITLRGLAAEADTGNVDTVTNLSIGENRTLSVYAKWSTDMTEATVKVTGSANFASGAKMNGNLELASGATVTLADELTMGSTLKLNEGMTLNGAMLTSVTGLTAGNKVSLFTGVDGLTLGSAASYDADTSLELGSELLSTYFTNITNQDIYLGYDAVENVVYAGMLSAAAVPEPTTATLSLLALAALAARRRRR